MRYRDAWEDWERKWAPWGLEFKGTYVIDNLIYRGYAIEGSEQHIAEVIQEAITLFGPAIRKQVELKSYLCLLVGKAGYGPMKRYLPKDVMRQMENKFPDIWEEIGKDANVYYCV